MAKLISGIVWVHLAVVMVHAAAHVGAGVELAPWSMAFVVVVIVAGPLLGLWMGGMKGLVIIALTMAASLGFGLWNHFWMAEADHVHSIQAGAWRAPFVGTAWGLSVVEAVGATVAGVAVFRRFPDSER